jgi:SAM-dependent MidA family methyltransferase
MSRTSLGKKELNERFYRAVEPEAAFATEVQVGFHQVAAARLVGRQAATTGRRKLRVLELGAGACLFALAFVEVLSRLVLLGDASVEAIDYTAVEYSRAALDAALRGALDQGFDQLATASGGAAGIAALARLRRSGAADAELSLVHTEANAFVDETDEPYDVVILNELLDDLPCRVYWADGDGATHELAPYAEPDGPRWKVHLTETDTPAPTPAAPLPPGTLTSTSDESLRLIAGVADRLQRGGLLLVHDYGFSDRVADAGQYVNPQLGLPGFVELDFPDTAGVPKSFFRVYGNEAAGEVQITNDVNFAELQELLEPAGMVLTLPHGNMLTGMRQYPHLFFKGDGVFLSEFMTLTAEDDLRELLADLHAHQFELRERYVTEFGAGRTAIFSDLIFVKA